MQLIYILPKLFIFYFFWMMICTISQAEVELVETFT